VTKKEHVLYLGNLMMNFQLLEGVIRAFLHAFPGQQLFNDEYAAKGIFAQPVGTYYPDNALTNYDSLGELIKKFNKYADQYAIQKVDISLVEIRDAIAHGRVFAQEPGQPESPFGLPLRLVKFDRPFNGKTKMVFNEIMTDSWFERQQIRVAAAHNIVWLALHSLDSYSETLKL